MKLCELHIQDKNDQKTLITTLEHNGYTAYIKERGTWNDRQYYVVVEGKSETEEQA